MFHVEHSSSDVSGSTVLRRISSRLRSVSTSGSSLSIVSIGTAGSGSSPGPRNRRQSAARLQERLRRHQRAELNPHRANRHDVAALVDRRVRQELLEPPALDAHVRELQLPHRLAEERALADLRFDHAQRCVRNLDLQRNGRRSAAGADVQDGSGALQDPGGRHRLEDQAVDGLVAIVQGGEVHPRVPRAEERQELRVRGSLLGRQVEIRAAGPPGDALPPVFGVPGQAGSIGCGRPGTRHWTATPPRPCSRRRSSRTMTAAAAGVTPDTRDAWPTVSGRISVRRCTISFDSPGTPA